MLSLEAAQAEAEPRYEFSNKWFSGNIRLFAQFLTGLKDRPCRLLEIGSYEGRSATWLVDHIATHPSAVIDAVDVCEHPKLRRNLAATGHADKVTFHLGPSAVVLRTLPLDSYDFAYIDGCHWTVNVLEDAVHAFRLLKAGGIMAFDDYMWDDPAENQEGRPKEAIDAFLSVYRDQVELLHRGNQVWIRKKLPGEIVHRKSPPLKGPRWLRHPRKQFVALGRRLRRAKFQS
jgi:predicted O-methyltransferase YrrM